MAATLAGVSSVRHATDHISYSEPNCPPTPWHCVIHEGFFSDTREAVGIQVQLDANTVQNKAMLFLPGSHLSAPFGRRHDTSPALDPKRPKRAAQAASGSRLGSGQRLVIQQDPETGECVYTVTDRDTGEVIAQLSREDVARMGGRAGYAAGALVKAKA